MTNIAILGGFAGDEAKGAFTHHLSKDFDWVVRFGGGANAGHTIYRDNVKYVHNLIPSFDWRSPKPKAYLSCNMVIDLVQLSHEVDKLYEVNKSLPSRVYVDLEAFLVLEEHKEEDKQTNAHIGSTNKGIGPAYKSKVSRNGKRILDATTDPKLSKLIDDMKFKGVNFVHQLSLMDDFKNSSILFEGAQGVMLDLNCGTYPYVSCSDATITGIYASGFTHVKLDNVYGVVKCYATRVGEGPFPTEIHGQEAEDLRKRGNEYGAVTGRPRKVGWLDLPALNYCIQKGGITDLIISKFDILDGMEKVPVCSSYDKMPVCPSDFFDCKVNLTEVEGWQSSKDVKQLRKFLDFVEQHTKTKVAYVSCGISPSDIHKL